MAHVYNEHGFEIHTSEDEMLLADRKTWALSYAMVVLYGLAALLTVLGLLVSLGAMETRSDLPAVALFGAAGALLLPIAMIRRAYKVRRDLPLAEVRDWLAIDRPTKALRSRQGEILSQLDSVRAAMHIDWWTRGMMRIVVLTWPGGKRVVFRSINRRRALAVLKMLADAGIQSS